VAGLSAPDDRVLYLDTGETAFWSRRRSYLRYFSPLPIQRVRFDPSLAETELHADVTAAVRAFRGKVLVWNPSWLPAGVSPAVDDLLSQYDVVRTIAPYEVRVRRPSAPG
jgi:hypothetical protein